MRLFTTANKTIGINMEKVESFESEVGAIDVTFQSQYVIKLRGDDARAFILEWNRLADEGRFSKS